LSFDGTDDIVTVPHTAQDSGLNDFWTLEAWIYPTAEQTAWQLNIVGFPQRHPNMNYCGQGNWQCPPGSPLVQLRDSNNGWFPVIGSTDRATPDQWHHIAGTWDNVTLSLYLDGVLDVAVNPYKQGYSEALSCSKSAMYSCDYGLQIGGNYFRDNGGIFSNQYFRGYIDEVRVWRHARSQQEIQSTMSTALAGNERGLLYYWRFDDYGSSVTKSSAYDLYALLGGGQKEAEPQFIMSSAPISAPPVTISGTPSPSPTYVVDKNLAGAVTSGALIAVFCLFGGIVLGVFLGWKSREKNYFGRSDRGENVSLIK